MCIHTYNHVDNKYDKLTIFKEENINHHSKYQIEKYQFIFMNQQKEIIFQFKSN